MRCAGLICPPPPPPPATASAHSLAAPALPALQAAKAGRALPQQQRPSRRGAARQQLAAGAGRRGTAVVAVAAAPDVSVSEERLEGCGVRLTISVPPEMCQQAYKKVGGWAARGRLHGRMARMVAVPQRSTRVPNLFLPSPH